MADLCAPSWQDEFGHHLRVIDMLRRSRHRGARPRVARAARTTLPWPWPSPTPQDHRQHQDTEALAALLASSQAMVRMAHVAARRNNRYATRIAGCMRM